MNRKQWIVTLVAVSCLPVFGCGSGPKVIPAEHAKLTIYTPSSSEASSLDVIVNNIKVGEADCGKSVVVSFIPMPDGKNTLEFVSGTYKKHSAKETFTATAGAELNVTVQYSRYAVLIPDSIKFDIQTVKAGEPLAAVTGASIEPTPIRRESLREVVRGEPGTKYTIKRQRTMERQVVFSESAKLELSAGLSVGNGLVEVSAKIKETLSTKDTVLMRDKEIIDQSVEVIFDSRGTATIQWVDFIRKGKATYRINGRVKELEFEVPYSSELTVIKE
jgi:hypothetical protein